MPPASRAMEIADREALEAEAETPDEDDGDHGEPEPEPEPEPDEPDITFPNALKATSDQDVDKALEKLEREAERHAKRVAEIMGAGFSDVHPCPLCWQPGFVLEGWGATLEEPQKNAVRAVIGDNVPEPLNYAPGFIECAACGGYGKLRYPGKNPHMATQTCQTCNGNGYTADNVTTTTGSAVYTLPPPTQLPPPLTNGPPIFDAWQRPQGHRDYGIPPAQVGA